MSGSTATKEAQIAFVAALEQQDKALIEQEKARAKAAKEATAARAAKDKKLAADAVATQVQDARPWKWRSGAMPT